VLHQKYGLQAMMKIFERMYHWVRTKSYWQYKK